MTTFGDLINSVEGYLYTYGMQRDKVTTLLEDISPTQTTFRVSDSRQIDRGFLEIDQELMAVQTVETASGTVMLHPWGRGQQGTNAVTHSMNSKVVASPRFPRHAIATQVRRNIDALYPDLYRVQVDESNSYSAGRVSYALPANSDSIVSVSYELPGPSREWLPLVRWRVTNHANTFDFPTGKALNIYDSVLPGRPLRIVYRASFGSFTAESDDMTSIGLKNRWADLLVYGACANLVLGMEPLRLQSDAVETQERAEAVQATQATSVARQLLGMFKQRVMEERSLLHREHPPVMTRRM